MQTIYNLIPNLQKSSFQTLSKIENTKKEILKYKNIFTSFNIVNEEEKKIFWV